MTVLEGTGEQEGEGVWEAACDRTSAFNSLIFWVRTATPIAINAVIAGKIIGGRIRLAIG